MNVRDTQGLRACIFLLQNALVDHLMAAHGTSAEDVDMDVDGDGNTIGGTLPLPNGVPECSAAATAEDLGVPAPVPVVGAGVTVEPGGFGGSPSLLPVLPQRGGEPSQGPSEGDADSAGAGSP